MAQHVEPMDIDSDFDNKENSLHHNNVLPFTEKGYEELDVSELNMKLRYSVTPASSPMSKSYTASCLDNRTLESGDHSFNVTINENPNLTRSLNSTISKNDSTVKSLKSLPLQVISADILGDSNRNTSVLRPLDTTITPDNRNITVTISGPSDIDENLSLPSSSSSTLQTPEATTPTKDIPPKDGGSPIMRGLKSVLNMFRTSQSPIPPTENEEIVKPDILSPVNSVSTPETLPRTLLASTPISSHRKKEMSPTKRSSPQTDSTVVFKEDLEKELQWKDESTIIFSQERIPIHKLQLQHSQDNKNSNKEVINLPKKVDQDVNSTVEYMDISYNDSIQDKTMTEILIDNKKSDGTLGGESDSEFLDCETTFTKNESKVLENTDKVLIADATADLDIKEDNGIKNDSGSRLKQIVLNTTQDILDATLSVLPEDLLSNATNDMSELILNLTEDIENHNTDTQAILNSIEPVNKQPIFDQTIDITCPNSFDTTTTIDIISSNQTIDQAIVGSNLTTNEETLNGNLDVTITENSHLQPLEDKENEINNTSILDDTVAPENTICNVTGLNDGDDNETKNNLNFCEHLDTMATLHPALLEEVLNKSLPLNNEPEILGTVKEASMTELPVDVPLPDEDDLEKELNTPAGTDSNTPKSDVCLPPFLIDDLMISNEVTETTTEGKASKDFNIDDTVLPEVREQVNICALDEDMHNQSLKNNNVVTVNKIEEDYVKTEAVNILPKVASSSNLVVSESDSTNLENNFIDTKPIVNLGSSKTNINQNIVETMTDLMNMNDSICESNPLPDIVNQSIIMCSTENKETPIIIADTLELEQARLESKHIDDLILPAGEPIPDPLPPENNDSSKIITSALNISIVNQIEMKPKDSHNSNPIAKVTDTIESVQVDSQVIENLREDKVDLLPQNNSLELTHRVLDTCEVDNVELALKNTEDIPDFNTVSEIVLEVNNTGHEQKPVMHNNHDDQVQNPVMTLPEVSEIVSEKSSNEADSPKEKDITPEESIEVLECKNIDVVPIKTGVPVTQTEILNATLDNASNDNKLKELDEEIVLSENNKDEEIVLSESNSPFVSVIADDIPVVNPAVDNGIDNTNSTLVTGAKVLITPPGSPPIRSKGYSFNFDDMDVDPFATHTNIRLSPTFDSPNKLDEPTAKSKTLEKPILKKDNNRRKPQSERKRPSAPKRKFNSTFDGTTNATISEKPVENIETEPVRDMLLKSPSSIALNPNNVTIDEKVINEPIVVRDSKEFLDIKPNVIKNNETKTSSELKETNEEVNVFETKDTSSSEQSTYFSAGTSSSESSIPLKNVFNLPEIDDINFNPFATKSKIRESPLPDIGLDNPFTTKNKLKSSPNSSMVVPHEVKAVSIEDKVETELMEKDALSNLSSTTSSSKVTDGKDGTVLEIHTEDEDTIEGPFLEAEDFNSDAKVSDFDVENIDMMKFNEMPIQNNDENVDSGEMFIDAEAFEFLLNQNKCNTVVDSGKESLFLKFDPLFAKRISLAPDSVLASLANFQKSQSTPTKAAKAPPNPPKNVASPIAGPSNMNITQDMDISVGEDDINITVSKPMMVVPPAVNPVTPRNKSITPNKSNRRSITFTSPAMAVIDRLLSLSANNSVVHDSPVTQVSREQKEADVALAQLRELLAEKEIHVYNLKSESSELRDRLSTLESHVKHLEEEGQIKLRKINELNDTLVEKTKINKSMAAVVEEYERTIASLVAEIEQDKKRHDEEKIRLINERDEQTAHLASMEVSFSDLHSKYEKSKQVIIHCKENEETYKKSIKQFDENLTKMQNNYELLKQHATSKLNQANSELEKMNRLHEAEVLKLNAMIKRKQLHITSLEESLAQKTKANDELTAICDELINKVG